MSVMVSQITSLTIVYSTVYSGTYERKHQISASLAVLRGIHRWPVNAPHKGPVTRKMFPFDDVIMVPHNRKIPQFFFQCYQPVIYRDWSSNELRWDNYVDHHKAELISLGHITPAVCSWSQQVMVISWNWNYCGGSYVWIRQPSSLQRQNVINSQLLRQLITCLLCCVFGWLCVWNSRTKYTPFSRVLTIKSLYLLH